MSLQATGKVPGKVVTRALRPLNEIQMPRLEVILPAHQ